MNKMTVPALALCACALLATAAHAGTFKGKILAHDRVAHRIVMEDKSVVVYDPAKVQLPDDLKAGDMVEVDFSGAEGDMATVNSIKVMK